MNKFDILKQLLTEHDSRGNPFIPEMSQEVFVMASFLSVAYAAKAIAYKCSLDASLMQELIEQIRSHNAHLAQKMELSMHGFNADFRRPKSTHIFVEFDFAHRNSSSSR